MNTSVLAFGKFLQKSGYTLDTVWREDRQEWQAILRNAGGVVIAESADAVLTTAVGVAILSAIQSQPYS